MDDKLNTIERKELPDSVLAYLKEENIQCRMPPMLELPRRISRYCPGRFKAKSLPVRSLLVLKNMVSMLKVQPYSPTLKNNREIFEL